MFGWFSVFFFGVTAVLFGQRMFLTAVGHNLGVCLVFYLCVLCVCTNIDSLDYLCTHQVQFNNYIRESHV